MNAQEYVYSGSELDVFALAQNWKRYWASQIDRYLSGDVLEVGAGLGTNTLQLQGSRKVRSWCCLEPDSSLVNRLRHNLKNKHIAPTEIKQGTLSDLENREFDSIIYIDVLEHIREDAAELSRAASHLRRQGKLIVLAPAHQWLFTPFDTAIGHYRRYTAARLKQLAPKDTDLLRTWYLDSLGLTLSLGNRTFLKQSQPTAKQISAWDRLVIPLSRLLDPILGYRIGKTVLAVWTRL